MMDQIKLMAFISLAVISLVIIVALFRKARKDRVLSDVEQLQFKFNELRTTPLSMKFNVAQAIAKRTGETDKEIKEYYSRYTNTQGLIDEIDNIFVELEDDKVSHNYGGIRKKLPELKEKIEICSNEIKETDIFLKKYETKDTEQRNFATQLKQEFQIVRDTVRQNIGQLTIAYDAIDERINGCSSLFTKSEDSMFSGDSLTAQEALEKIQSELHNIKLIVNAVPSIIKETTVVIPSLIDNCESSSAYTKQKGIYIDHLNVSEVVEKVRNELSECTKLVSSLQLDGLSERVQNAKNEITSLSNALVNEDARYSDAKKNVEEANLSLINIKNVIDFIKASSDANENLYSASDDKPNIDAFNSEYSDYKASHLNLQSRLENLNEPVSLLNEEIAQLLEDCKKFKEDLLEIKTGLDKNVGDVQRAKTSLVKFQLVVNQAEISVRASHLPSISEKFSEDLNNCKSRIAEIKEMISKTSINLEELNQKVDEATSYIYNFVNDVKNIVGLSIMVENAIVFGNKFRSTHSEIDSDLSKSEFLFLNGEYTKAVQLAIQTMDRLYPSTKEETQPVNN